MSPATLTAAPASPAASASRITRIRPTRRPRLRAVSLPSAKTSSSLVSSSTPARHTAPTAAAGPTRAMVTLPSPPTRKSE